MGVVEAAQLDRRVVGRSDHRDELGTRRRRPGLGEPSIDRRWRSSRSSTICTVRRANDHVPRFHPEPLLAEAGNAAACPPAVHARCCTPDSREAPVDRRSCESVSYHHLEGADHERLDHRRHSRPGRQGHPHHRGQLRYRVRGRQGARRQGSARRASRADPASRPTRPSPRSRPTARRGAPRSSRWISPTSTR